MNTREQQPRDLYAPPNLGARVLVELTDTERDDLFKTLTNVVRLRCRNHPDIDPRDVVYEAFVRVRSGRRGHWNIRYTPLENMCFVVKDILFHLTRDHRMEQLNENWEQTLPSSLFFDCFTPLDNLLKNCELNEEAERYESRQMLIASAIADDPLLQRFWSAVKKLDRWDTRLLANELGVDAKTIYQVTRKLKRRVITLLKTSSRSR